MLYCQIDVYFDDTFKILTSFFIFYLIICELKRALYGIKCILMIF